MKLNASMRSAKGLRVYADTSVFGGCFDPEFAKDSTRFFDEVKAGKIWLITSDVLLFELKAAPPHVMQILRSLPTGNLAHIELTEEMLVLRDAYLSAQVLPRNALNDAAHIAAATAGDVDLLVSWNFKHIVHYEKIRGFNAVNLLMGYRSINIYSPKEVISI